ncbi:unnamed protein product [Litomosoides sigmodontis]|uniref:Uncharacterized protein n=1 Tax=Litomosoides sigmodontis TaxID=42156 RepID=A0A3P7M9L4_LITSI|nr:unnamed protein product [Litomosoides sigmodontis]
MPFEMQQSTKVFTSVLCYHCDRYVLSDGCREVLPSRSWKGKRAQAEAVYSSKCMKCDEKGQTGLTVNVNTDGLFIKKTLRFLAVVAGALLAAVGDVI